MKSRKLSTILTDVGGVLIRNYDGTAADVRQRLGLNDEAFKQLWPPLIARYGRGEIDEQTFWEQFAEHGMPFVSTTENIFGKPFEEHFEEYTEVIQAMQRLKQSGIQLAILSNTIEPHARVHRSRGTYAIFEPYVFLSHEIGLSKPGIAAYEYSLQKLGVVAEEVVFIDDRQDNLDSAQKLGMQTIHATSPHQTVALLEDLFRTLR